ncbi:hypothetical protein RUMCAL_03072 [Ruminococcus callidus ATCC 27760]|uniref:Uncharacterized protein n=1 Tax=Ruminococcus callidus ATCC 27760 TaxID=411473 RepID=U2LNL2_9FIRM|nr:hypothetical protein RUMCAL_03072 [Ruminococcus callidus ATCC 27760]
MSSQTICTNVLSMIRQGSLCISGVSYTLHKSPYAAVLYCNTITGIRQRFLINFS